jgi:hypothetical protein
MKITTSCFQGEEFMKNILGYLTIIVLLITTVYGIFLFGQNYQLKNKTKLQELQNTAVDGCGKLASSVKEGEFSQPLYAACLKDKGYSSSLK